MPKPQAARLLAVNRDESNTRLLLLGKGEVAVGSEFGAALKIAGPGVAGRHASINYRRGGYYLTDRKAPGGTFVNDMPVRSARLQHGDTVRFAGIAYRFIDPDAAVRQRRRRMIRVSIVATIAIVAVAAHMQQWDRQVISAAARIAPKGWQPPPDVPRVAIQVAARETPQPALVPQSAAPTRQPEAVKTTVPVVPIVAASAMPTPKPLPPEKDAWLHRINLFRTMAGVGAIRANPKLSTSVEAHANYLMTNYGEELRARGWIGDAAYKEIRSKKGYSSAGAAAAANSQVAWGCGRWDGAEQIDRWIAGPFHRLEILTPALKEAGFGEALKGGCWVAALRMPPAGGGPGLYASPVEFPPNGSTVSISFVGGELPDPLATCPGYRPPVGLPITLEIGRLTDIKLGRASLTEDGRDLEHCIFDAQGYHSSNPASQEYGRWALRSHGAIVMVPRAPLKPGPRYQVSISANNRTYSWSFQVAEEQKSAPAEEPSPAGETAPRITSDD